MVHALRNIKALLTPRLVFVGLLASVATFSQGYDNGWWGFILAVPGFNAIFSSTPDKKLDIVQLGIGTAMTNIGTILSAPFVAWTVNKYGRVRGFYCYSILTIVATIIQITCGVGGVRYWQLVGGKFVIGFAIGFGSLVVPLYLSEVAPGQIRGTLINFYSFNTWLGTLLATAMAYAVKNRSTQIVFILPVAVQFVPAVINLLCAPLMPESPRWLCSQGRHDEAKRSLASLYGGRSGGFNVEAEYEQLRNDVERISSHTSRPWKDCFKGTDGTRTAISVGALCLLQGQGLGFVASYSNILLAELTPAYAEIFIAILGVLVVLSSISFVTLDNIGRRTLLLYGSAISAVCMISYAIVYSISHQPEGRLAALAVAFLTIWLVVYTQSWSTAPFAIYSETPSAELRAKTLALGSIGSQLVNVVVTLTSPFIESSNNGDFGGQIGYIFGSVSIFAFFFTFFLIPELKRRSLEEVDMMFKSGVKIRDMGQYKVDTELDLSVDPQSSILGDDLKGQEGQEETVSVVGARMV